MQTDRPTKLENLRRKPERRLMRFQTETDVYSAVVAKRNRDRPRLSSRPNAKRYPGAPTTSSNQPARDAADPKPSSARDPAVAGLMRL